MKKIIYLSVMICSIALMAQHKKIIYGFDEIPQGLLLNPGAQTDYKIHIGVPLLSGASSNFNISGITVADLFRNQEVGIFDSEGLDDKIIKAAHSLDEDDYLYFNTQIEVLNLGYKISRNNYLSTGFYIEKDIFSTLPKDVAILASQGNADHIGKSFDIGQVSLQGEVLGVFHLGLSRIINNKLTMGARLKLYSGSVNVTSIKNKGTFTTENGTNSVYVSKLSDFSASVKTSGILDDDDKAFLETKEVISNSFFSGNLGFGLDLGFTYYLNDQFKLSGSVLDMGYINYTKNNVSFKANANLEYTGVDLEYTAGETQNDSWNKFKTYFEENADLTRNEDKYIVTRPVKGYLDYSYSFGKSKNRATCHDDTYKDFYDNTAGLQLFTVIQPNGANLAYTAYFQRKITHGFNIKATYTIDDFSYANVGLGISINYWKLNFYGSVGNIFGIGDVAARHMSSAQFGINFLLD